MVHTWVFCMIPFCAQRRKDRKEKIEVNSLCMGFLLTIVGAQSSHSTQRKN
jgi:hypothetical protein